MKIEETLLEEARLGELAERIIFYRYKIYSATAVALTSMSALLILLVLYFYWPRPNLLALTIFAAPFIVAAILSMAFSKTFCTLHSELSKKGRRLSVKRINLVFAASYSLPFIALYSVNPLPSWEEYAWYIALALAHTSAYLFYERYMNALLEMEVTRAYKILSALFLATTPIVIQQALTEPQYAQPTALILYTLVSIATVLEEIYGAERML